MPSHARCQARVRKEKEMSQLCPALAGTTWGRGRIQQGGQRRAGRDPGQETLALANRHGAQIETGGHVEERHERALTGSSSVRSRWAGVCCGERASLPTKINSLSDK